jgi:hypothetical protein
MPLLTSRHPFTPTTLFFDVVQTRDQEPWRGFSPSLWWRDIQRGLPATGTISQILEPQAQLYAPEVRRRMGITMYPTLGKTRPLAFAVSNIGQ